MSINERSTESMIRAHGGNTPRALSDVLRSKGLYLLENLASSLGIFGTIQADVEDEARADDCT